MIDFSKQTGKKILVIGSKMKLIDINKILYIKKEKRASIIFLTNGRKLEDKKPLLKHEKELLEMGFFRIRENTIINGKHIIEVDIRVDRRTVNLDKTSFSIAKNRLKAFVGWIS
jgi:DNA-binding LytR/AlgR family response regulator